MKYERSQSYKFEKYFFEDNINGSSKLSLLNWYKENCNCLNINVMDYRPIVEGGFAVDVIMLEQSIERCCVKVPSHNNFRIIIELMAITFKIYVVELVRMKPRGFWCHKAIFSYFNIFSYFFVNFLFLLCMKTSILLLMGTRDRKYSIARKSLNDSNHILYYSGFNQVVKHNVVVLFNKKAKNYWQDCFYGQVDLYNRSRSTLIMLIQSRHMRHNIWSNSNVCSNCHRLWDNKI